MPHQDQSPKLGPPVDLGISAGPRLLERAPMTTSIASSFDAPTNLVTTPVITSEPSKPVNEPDNLDDDPMDEPVNTGEPDTLNKEEPSVSNERNPVKPGTPVRPRESIHPIEEPVTTPVVM